MGTSTIRLRSIKSSLPFSLRHSHDKLFQALSRFSVLEATESWAGLGNEAIVNVLTDTHFSFLSFLTAHTAPTPFLFLYIMVLNVFFTTCLAKIYPVATIKICLEFAKMGQSTDKNKLQLSLSTNFGIVRMRTTTIFERL